MTIAFDTTTNVAAGTGNLSWTHTPVGTPRGILVLIVQDITAADQITSVTYGGVALSAVAGSPLLHTNGSEDGAIYGYFLGSSIPTGNQTVDITVSAGAAKRAVCYSVTAAANTEIEDTTADDTGTVANPSVNVTLASGVSAFVAGVLHSGQNSPTFVAEIANTTLVLEYDFGSACGVWSRRTNIETGAGDFAIGWTATSDESAILAVAIKESAASTWIPKIYMITEG